MLRAASNIAALRPADVLWNIVSRASHPSSAHFRRYRLYVLTVWLKSTWFTYLNTAQIQDSSRKRARNGASAGAGSARERAARQAGRRRAPRPGARRAADGCATDQISSRARTAERLSKRKRSGPTARRAVGRPGTRPDVPAANAMPAFALSLCAHLAASACQRNGNGVKEKRNHATAREGSVDRHRRCESGGLGGASSAAPRFGRAGRLRDARARITPRCGIVLAYSVWEHGID